ncbi:MAG: hypothetical protein ACRCUJ_08015 [Phocaeicola sp.]
METKKQSKRMHLMSLMKCRVTENGQFEYKLTKEGRECQFLQFLINTSNFTWRKSGEEKDTDEEYANNQCILSKLCAIGYLMIPEKQIHGKSPVHRAVVAYDPIIGSSRTGKTLLGLFIDQFKKAMKINAFDLQNPFVWGELGNNQLVIIDADRGEFNFEDLFPNITGDWFINKKCCCKEVIPVAKSPKIYITTNHPIRGAGSSFTDRRWMLSFSDFYSNTHVPADDFGKLFFCEWDYLDLCSAYQLISTCIKLYHMYGVVQSPEII